MISLPLLLALSAFVLTLAGALGKCPWWVPVFLICVLLLLQGWR